MSSSSLDSFIDILDSQITELQETQKKREEKYKGDGSTPATWEKVDPKIRRDVVEACRDDLREADGTDEVLRVLAEWRWKRDEEWTFMANKSKIDNERNRIRRDEIRPKIESLAGTLEDGVFDSCIHCDSNKMPKRDRRYSRGYDWECPNCFI